MKKVIYFFLFFASINSFSQSYTAIDSVTYNVGDSIIIGRGSNANKEYVYLSMAGAAGAMLLQDDKNIQLGAGFEGIKAPIRRMKSYKINGQSRMVFTVKMGIVNYAVLIDQAILSGEVISNKLPK